MTNELPSLDDAAGLAQGIARGMDELCEDPYGEPAATELERGQELYEQGFGNPVAFAYKSMESYARVAGDLLYGTGEVSRDRYGLGFSSAAVARSACEYAGIGWWLAEPRISVERRIGRTALLVERSYDHAKGLLDQCH